MKKLIKKDGCYSLVEFDSEGKDLVANDTLLKITKSIKRLNKKIEPYILNEKEVIFSPIENKDVIEWNYQFEKIMRIVLKYDKKAKIGPVNQTWKSGKLLVKFTIEISKEG